MTLQTGCQQRRRVSCTAISTCACSCVFTEDPSYLGTAKIGPGHKEEWDERADRHHSVLVCNAGHSSRHSCELSRTIYLVVGSFL